jgi:hypothetical protein
LVSAACAFLYFHRLLALFHRDISADLYGIPIPAAICPPRIPMQRMTSSCRPAGEALLGSARHIVTTELCMLDIVMLVIGVALFALSIGYVYACDLL